MSICICYSYVRTYLCIYIYGILSIYTVILFRQVIISFIVGRLAGSTLVQSRINGLHLVDGRDLISSERVPLGIFFERISISKTP